MSNLNIEDGIVTLEGVRIEPFKYSHVSVEWFVRNSEIFTDAVYECRYQNAPVVDWVPGQNEFEIGWSDERKALPHLHQIEIAWDYFELKEDRMVLTPDSVNWNPDITL